MARLAASQAAASPVREVVAVVRGHLLHWEHRRAAMEVPAVVATVQAKPIRVADRPPGPRTRDRVEVEQDLD
jgi:hypothetical protein